MIKSEDEDVEVSDRPSLKDKAHDLVDAFSAASFKAVDHDRVFAAVKNKLNEAKEDLEDASDDVKDATEDEEKVDTTKIELGNLLESLDINITTKEEINKKNTIS